MAFTDNGLEGPRLCLALITKADRRVKIADHLLNITFPMIKDSKMLINIIENLFLAAANAMTSLLIYERYRKNIDNFKDNFDSKFKIFTRLDYGFDNNTLKTIKDIRDIVVQHRKTSIEFRHKEDFVIITDDQYSYKKINHKLVKKYLNTIRDFVEETKLILEHRIRDDYRRIGVKFK